MTQHLYPRDTFVSHTLLSSRVCAQTQTCAHECMIYVQDKSIRQARSVLHIAMISARSAKTVATCAIAALLQATSAIWRHNKRPIVDRRSPFAIYHLPFSRLFVRSLSCQVEPRRDPFTVKLLRCAAGRGATYAIAKLRWQVQVLIQAQGRSRAGSLAHSLTRSSSPSSSVSSSGSHNT